MVHPKTLSPTPDKSGKPSDCVVNAKLTSTAAAAPRPAGRVETTTLLCDRNAGRAYPFGSLRARRSSQPHDVDVPLP